MPDFDVPVGAPRAPAAKAYPVKACSLLDLRRQGPANGLRLIGSLGGYAVRTDS